MFHSKTTPMHHFLTHKCTLLCDHLVRYYGSQGTGCISGSLAATGANAIQKIRNAAEHTTCTEMLRSLRFAARGSVRAGRDAFATRASPAAFAVANANASRCFSAKSFHELGIHAKIEQALQEMGINHPTSIQQKSIQAILAKKDVLCTAQTGTGKTLAYLVPVVEQILRSEAVQTDDEKKTILVSRPQAIVLTPSRELATQVSDVAKRLSHAAKFASCTVTSGERKSIQQKSLSRRLDLLIGTPGRVARCIKGGDFFVSRINTIVVDEADTLFDAKMGFRKELDEILGPIQASAAKRNQPLQIILAAATIKPPLDQVLMKRFGDLRLVSDDKIHRTPATIQEEFVRVTPESKHSALRDALHLREFKKEKTIVFCQNSASCRSTDHMLRENGFQSLCLHGGMPPQLRLESVEKFTNDDKLKVLVCTDLAARGLDFSDVRHVIMFDFPKSAVDYVHRAGRTGRAGVKGFVTSLVSKYDLPLANSIDEATRHRKTIKEFRSSKVEGGAIPLDKPEHEEQDDAPKRSVKKQVRGKAAFGTKKLKHHKIRSFRR